MANLKTTYMGIELKNPIIIGSNNLVTDAKNAKAVEDAGAAAIVYKSLFEEQIKLESYEMDVIDYLVKPIRIERFIKAVNKAEELYKMKNFCQNVA